MKIIAKATYLSIIAIVFSINASAGSFEDGKKAYNQKNYEQAFTLWRTSARNGHAESQFNLGYMYHYGQGVIQSNQQAIFWYEKAAKLGFPDAITSLETLKGKGVAMSPLGEEKQFDEKKSANNSGVPKQAITEPKNINSLEKTAHKYFTGNGVEKSPKKAVDLYKQAANNGSLSAQNQLAVLYTYGLYGMVKSDVEAAHWYEMAAQQGNVAAMYATGVNYYDGKGVEQSIKLATQWFEKAANSGYAAAELRLKTLNAQSQRK